MVAPPRRWRATDWYLPILRRQAAIGPVNARKGRKGKGRKGKKREEKGRKGKGREGREGKDYDIISNWSAHLSV